MVIAVVVKEIVRFAARYYRFEGKAFSKLYTGFPQSRRIGTGVRHGLTAGSIAGTFINNAEDSPGNGTQTPVRPKVKPPSGQSYQARNRQTSRSGSRRIKCYQPDFFSTRPRSR